MAYALLEKPCSIRYELRQPGGKLYKMLRDGTKQCMYGPPRKQAQAYIWPEARNRYIVALATETRHLRWGRTIGCYHTFPTKTAATMFVYAMTGEGK
jgi:hypothetical protein